MNHLQFDQSKPRDVVALGRSGVDLFPDQFGPMEEVISFTKYVGGSPANTSVQMAKMGLDVGFIGMVSHDQFGNFIRLYLKSKGVDVTHVIDDPDPNVRNSLAVAEQMAKGTVQYFFYRNDVADLHLSMADVSEAYIAQFKALLISGTSLCVSPVREAVFLAIEYAKRNNVRIIFDPDHRDMAWKTLDDASIYYWTVAQKSDAIFSTRDEFDVLERVILPGNQDDSRSAANLFRYEPKLICIKHGQDGSTVYTRDGDVYKGSIYPARVYKVLGAGDSYAGAFIAQIVRNQPIEKALKYGAASASLTISGRSCADSMPTLALVEDYLKACDAGLAEQWTGWSKL